ncbi:MAG: hypothetical protein ACMUHX_06375 [bacterium]
MTYEKIILLEKGMKLKRSDIILMRIRQFIIESLTADHKRSFEKVSSLKKSFTFLPAFLYVFFSQV